MLNVSTTTFRLFLHILAATVWVGGQIVLAGIVPTLRKHGGVEATRAVARRFQIIAWIAFGLLLITGIWNLLAVHVGNASTAYLATLFVKLLLVGIAAAGTIGHIVLTKTRPALGGALAGISLLCAIAVVLLGVRLPSRYAA